MTYLPQFHDAYNIKIHDVSQVNEGRARNDTTKTT